jgi:hypothetical protein
MVRETNNSVTLLVAPGELPTELRVWGTGGWLAPEEREALDWLTLCRLMGWEVNVQRAGEWNLNRDSGSASGCIILACDPGQLSEETIDWLASPLTVRPLLIVTRAGSSEEKFARLCGAASQTEPINGLDLSWRGPGVARHWNCRNSFEVRPLQVTSDNEVWATLNGKPVIAARRFGRGVVATLGFHPSRGRDADGAVTALLKHLLVWGAPGPVAWLDFEGTMALRMDDPGGAQNIHSRTWAHRKLSESDWLKLGADLKRRNGRLSIAYVSGWVDDADPARGSLRVAGESPARKPGAVYDSPLVEYHDLNGHAPGTTHDYASEYRGIQALRAANLAEVELHGYTHMNPDSSRWARAPDRYDSVSWYRELGVSMDEYLRSIPAKQHPLARGITVLHRYFQSHPTTLIPPGDEWTPEAIERALDLKLQMVSSYYLAIRHHERFCWAQHVCAPYLDEPAASWFDSGLPVIGYFHDRDLGLRGVEWMSQALDKWQEAGATRIIDFRELAAAIGRRLHVSEIQESLLLKVTSEGAPALVKPLIVAIRSTANTLPSRIAVEVDGRELSLPVCPSGDGQGWVQLPCAGSK